jgi:hypothetical protein
LRLRAAAPRLGQGFDNNYDFGDGDAHGHGHGYGYAHAHGRDDSQARVDVRRLRG